MNDRWIDQYWESVRRINEEIAKNLDGELTEEQKIEEAEIERKINEERGT